MITDKYYVPEPNSGCWLWDKALFKNGYGSFRKHTYAHRAMWEQNNGGDAR